MPNSDIHSAAAATLEMALEFASRGMSVLPLHSIRDGRCTCMHKTCSSPAKHPRTKHGHGDASTSPDQIAMWWKSAPFANLGVRTGAGLLVLDVDPRNGGHQSLEKLVAEHGPLPDTWTVETGGGGEHYYYLAEGEVPTRTALFPGIDLKGDGGFVVAPPSLHASGKRYRWAPRRGPRDLALVHGPTWMLAASKAQSRPAKNVTDLHITEGGRNTHLASFAGRARRRGLDGVELLAATLDENAKRCVPPLPRGEVERIAASIARYPSAANGHDVSSVLVSTGAAALTKQSPAADRERVLGKLAEVTPTLNRLQSAMLRDELIRGRVFSAKVVDAALRSALPDAATAAQGKMVVLNDPPRWEEPVAGAALLDELVAAIRRHVVLPGSAADAVALWIVHTHALDAAQITPRLAVLSPEKRCGKTTVLKLLFRLVRRPLPTTNVTAAALFRTIEKFQPTLLVDEADTFLSEREELRGVLNAGHDREGATVLRCVGDEAEPRVFATWAPIALAGIGSLHDTLSDRSVVIRMQRRKPDEAVAPLRRRDQHALAPLPRKCARWVADHASELAGLDVKGPPELNDRATDNWEPLFAIADIAGGEWPARARRAALVLSKDPEDEGPGTRAQSLLTDIRELFQKIEGDRIVTKDLLRELNALEGRPWADYSRGKGISAHQMAAMLRRFGIQARNVRVATGIAKGYLADEFTDAFARYLGSQSATSATSAEAQLVSDAVEPQNAGLVADRENVVSQLFLADVADVAAFLGVPLAHERSLDLDEYEILTATDQHERDGVARVRDEAWWAEAEAAYLLAERQAIQEFDS